MARTMSTAEYLLTPETLRRRDLAFGVVRDAAAPSFLHQIVAGRIYRALAQHVEPQLGIAVMAPVDVVLDHRRALVVQPDVLFVSNERLAMCTDRVWGAPDLTVEVLSRTTYRADQYVKAAWYREYGVRECWMVDPVARWVEVMDLEREGCACRFEVGAIIRSAVLPALHLPVASVFAR